MPSHNWDYDYSDKECPTRETVIQSSKTPKSMDLDLVGEYFYDRNINTLVDSGDNEVPGVAIHPNRSWNDRFVGGNHRTNVGPIPKCTSGISMGTTIGLECSTMVRILVKYAKPIYWLQGLLTICMTAAAKAMGGILSMASEQQSLLTGSMGISIN